MISVPTKVFTGGVEAGRRKGTFKEAAFPIAAKPMNAIPAESAPVRVFVIEDVPSIRARTVAWIRRQPGLALAGEGESLACARCKLGREVAADVVLMDLVMKGRDNIDAIRECKALFRRVPLVVFSKHDEMLYAERVLRAGASGYVMKDETSDTIVKALQMVAAGKVHVSPQVAQLIVQKVAGRSVRSKRHGVTDMTRRERQIFGMLGSGLTPRQISQKLALSVKTVEAHRENIRFKLGVGSAAEVQRQAVLWHRAQERAARTAEPR